MGTLTSGPLSQLAILLARQFGAQDFVETGTFRGDTTRWASGCFSRVSSIEMSEEYFREASAALTGLTNVKLHRGDSATVLKEVVAELTGPAVFWLDAHAGEAILRLMSTAR